MSDPSIPTFPAADAVDPATVPQRRLRSGASMPAIGLGTFGSDHVPHAAVAAAVLDAAALGYRHFDCASVYGNEDLIGQSFQQIMRSGIKREELWITSKLWNDKHDEADVIPTCEKSLRDLKLDWLRRQVSVVLQDAILFSTTIGENIAFGLPHATPRQIEAAAVFTGTVIIIILNGEAK